MSGTMLGTAGAQGDSPCLLGLVYCQERYGGTKILCVANGNVKWGRSSKWEANSYHVLWGPHVRVHT